MNWIKYRLQKPKPEPKRQIWVKLTDTMYSWFWSTHSMHWENVTHWAEIEGPKEVRERTCYDPFEEWWECKESFSYADVERAKALGQLERDKFLARAAWDAAVKHMTRA